MSLLFDLYQGKLPRLVMFDLDGTLIDSAPDIAWSVDQMLARMAQEPVGLDLVRTWVGNGAQRLVERALEHYGLELNNDSVAEALNEFRDIYAEHCADDTVVYSGVFECLSWLHDAGCTLACVTNKPLELTTPILEALDLEEYFELTVGGECLPTKKPHAGPLEYVMDAFDCIPAESLMVGDSKNDILGAKNAGCQSVCVSYGYNQGENMSMYEPELMVDSLIELL